MAIDYRGRLTRARITRRSAMAGLGAGGAGLAALLAGCSSSNKSSSAGSGGAQNNAAKGGSPAAQQPKKGGSLTRLTADAGSFTAGFDPHKTGGSETGLMNFFYQSLLRQHPVTFEILPELAQKWEQPDPQTYVLHLASGVKWHNKPPVSGRAFTSDDVVYSLNRARTNDPAFVNRSVLDHVDQITAPDAATVKVTTKVADATTLLNLSDLTMLMLAKEAVEKFGKLTTADQVIGTGAFVLTQYDTTGATVTRNQDYWKQGLPYLDQVKLVAMQDPQVRVSAFRAKQLDVTQIPGSEVKNFLDQPNWKTSWSPGVSLFMIHPNTKVKPFDDPRVTHALRLLVDHNEAITGYINVWWGNGTSYTLVHALQDWDLTKDEYAQLPEWKPSKDDATKQALQLLSAAGYSKENPLKFTLTNNQEPTTGTPQGQLVQAEWQKNSQGVLQVQLQLFENSISRQKETQGQFEVEGPVARGSQFDPDQVFSQIYQTGGSNNYAKYSDTTLDGMIDKQRGIFDVTQRKAAVKDVVKYLVDHAPQTNYSSRDILNATQTRVQGFLPESGRQPGWQYEQIWLNS